MVKVDRQLQQQSESLATKFPPLLLAASQVADSIMLGLHGRRRPGSGETFWQYRRYQPTDPASLIDWRQSAKSQHVFVREQEWETSQSVWMWCDRSKSMEFHSSLQLDTKKSRSELLVLALAILLLRGGEKVGLLGSGGVMVRGIGGLPRLVKTLTLDVDEPFQESLPDRGKAPKGSQVVFVSDFLEPLKVVEERIKWYSSQGHAGLLLQVLDPVEITLPYMGRAKFRGLEGEEETVVGEVGNVRADYQERMRLHTGGLKDLANNIGWSFVSHNTDKPPSTALLALYVALSQEAG